MTTNDSVLLRNLTLAKNIDCFNAYFTIDLNLQYKRCIDINVMKKGKQKLFD